MHAKLAFLYIFIISFCTIPYRRDDFTKSFCKPIFPTNIISISIEFILWANYILLCNLRIVVVEIILVPYKMANTDFIY